MDDRSPPDEESATRAEIVGRELANERTMLGWTRTSLSLMAAGAVAARAPQVGLVREGIGMIALGAFVWFVGFIRYRTVGSTLRAGHASVRPWVLLSVSSAVTIAALGALVLVLAGA